MFFSLIVLPLGHLNVMSPPLIMTRGQIDTFVDILRESLEATQADLAREGLWIEISQIPPPTSRKR